MLKRTHITYLIETDDGDQEVTVEVRTADQMVAEAVAQRNGILGSLVEAPISHTVTWAYCAAVREGKFAGEFQAFRQACVTFTEQESETAVDPTWEPPASGSESPPTSETPDSGSTPS